MKEKTSDQINGRRQFLASGAAVAGASALGACSSLPTGSKQAAGYVLPPPPIVSMEIIGSSDRFPVRRVYCLGRNYVAHAIESGDDPDKTPPFFFMKPADAVVDSREGFPYPQMTKELRYEAELVVALKSGGKDIKEADALNHVYGYGVGLDMTRQDLQVIAQKLSRPWTISKAFDKSAPCGPLYPVAKHGHAVEGRIWLSVNGVIKQDSKLSLQRWSVPQAIVILSQHFELMAGDIILTGTPDGIGVVKAGDVMKVGIDGLGEIETKVV
jgi:fumarylpyruvate hydrolase